MGKPAPHFLCYNSIVILPLNFRKIIDKCIENNTGAIFKKFFDDTITPNWEEIFNCIHQQMKPNIPGKDFSKDKQPHEELYGNVFVSDQLYLTTHLEPAEFNNYFPKISEVLPFIEESAKIQLKGIGPKVCIGPHIIKFHKDQWHAFALQCEGKAKWILSNTEDGTGTYLEEFYPERGDLLFFPVGMWHRIETQDAPRGGIQFNARII